MSRLSSRQDGAEPKAPSHPSQQASRRRCSPRRRRRQSVRGPQHPHPSGDRKCREVVGTAYRQTWNRSYVTKRSYEACLIGASALRVAKERAGTCSETAAPTARPLRRWASVPIVLSPGCAPLGVTACSSLTAASPGSLPRAGSACLPAVLASLIFPTQPCPFWATTIFELGPSCCRGTT
jgi:hypothetical protein